MKNFIQKLVCYDTNWIKKTMELSSAKPKRFIRVDKTFNNIICGVIDGKKE